MIYLSLLLLFAPALAQKCYKAGYGVDQSCNAGSDPYCDGARCLYQICAKGYYATEVYGEGTIYDTMTANLCTICPGANQTTDVSAGITYGIGECYVPCGPAKCYVPSSGGLSASAVQSGVGVCVNDKKGICEPTCKQDGQVPVPDAYTIGNACHSTQSTPRRAAVKPRASATKKKRQLKKPRSAPKQKKSSRPSYEKERGPYALEGFIF